MGRGGEGWGGKGREGSRRKGSGGEERVKMANERTHREPAVSTCACWEHVSAHICRGPVLEQTSYHQHIRVQ